jgi:hypothetical protein
MMPSSVLFFLVEVGMSVTMRSIPLWSTVETWVLDIAKNMEYFFWEIPENRSFCLTPPVIRRRVFRRPVVYFETAASYREEVNPEPNVHYSYPCPYTVHETICIRAMEEGKFVPNRVLADYSVKPWAKNELNRRKRKGFNW